MRILAYVDASSLTTSREFRLTSTPFTVNADLYDLRSLDKGVKFMRQLKKNLRNAIRTSENAGGEVNGYINKVEDSLKEILAEMDGRSIVLGRAVDYSPWRGMISSRKRIILSGGPSPDSPEKGGETIFKKVVIMGPYHSGANFMASALESRFEVQVINWRETSKADATWKHRVNHHPFENLGSDVLAVLMVKEPHFWLKSIARRASQFFEIHPFRENDEGEREDVAPQNMEDLFTPFEHDTLIYPNAIGLWNDTIRSYLDDEVYPSKHSVLVRFEDFLFNFHDVMDELGNYGFRDRDKAKPMQDDEYLHFNRESRTRKQALRYYSDMANWKSNFSPEELETLHKDMDGEAVARLGYSGPNPMKSWALRQWCDTRNAAHKAAGSWPSRGSTSKIADKVDDVGERKPLAQAGNGDIDKVEVRDAKNNEASPEAHVKNKNGESRAARAEDVNVAPSAVLPSDVGLSEEIVEVVREKLSLLGEEEKEKESLGATCAVANAELPRDLGEGKNSTSSGPLLIEVLHALTRQMTTLGTIVDAVVTSTSHPNVGSEHGEAARGEDTGMSQRNSNLMDPRQSNFTEVQRAIIDVDVLVHQLAAKLPKGSMTANGVADCICLDPPSGLAACIDCKELITKNAAPLEALGGQPLRCRTCNLVSNLAQTLRSRKIIDERRTAIEARLEELIAFVSDDAKRQCES